MQFCLVDTGTLDTAIKILGTDVTYWFSQDYRNSFETFEEFWDAATKDMADDMKDVKETDMMEIYGW